jgi:hypothetical protein
VGGSSGSSQLGPGGGPTEMISYGRSDANGKVLVECVGENLLPTAQARRPFVAGLSGSDSMHQSESYLPVLRPRSSSGLGHEVPGSVVWRWDGPEVRRDAWKRQPGEADGPPWSGNAQLGTDLAQTPTLGVQVGRSTSTAPP